MLSKAAELKNLRQETKAQKVQIQAFVQTVGDLKQQMARLKEFDAKLRVITDIGLPKGDSELVGMGGAQEPELYDMLISTGSAEGELAEEIDRDLSYLQSAAAQQQLSFQELTDAIKDKQSKWASTPSIWPVRGWLTSDFGKRVSPFSGGVSMHKGIDIATQMNKPVIAPAAGVVSYSGYHSGLGKLLKINHGNGIQTLYGHLAKFNARPGQRVKRGDVVAYVGNTGLSTGPHLHYEVRVNRIPTNPLKYILN
jgi:murein DD-endopeptidase MepM/ murein hydrolase activator NlpD